MKHLLPTLLPLLLISASTMAQMAVPLFAAGNLNGWQLQNTETAYFSYGGTTLTVTGDRGWLQSPDQYGDFILEGQFRFTAADSDSGIFLRVVPGTEFIRGWPGNAYQVQIRDISVNSTDNPLPLANLYRHRVADGDTRYQRESVFTLYSGVGAWQDLRIIAIGSKLVVELNGEVVTLADNLVNATGHIGFQSEKGTIEYRNLVIHAF